MTGPVAIVAVALLCRTAAAAEFPKAPAAAPTNLEAVTLRVDWLFSIYHSPFFLGIAKGWYREAGIDLSIKEGRGSGSVIKLVGNNSDTFGFAAADAVVRGVQANVPVVSLATMMPKDSNAIYVLKKSGIRRPQDLRGKMIATTPGGTSDALLPAFLKGAGLGIGDVTIVPVDAAVKVQTLLQGKVDAINLQGMLVSPFAQAGGAIVFPYADWGVQVVGWGIVTNTERVKSDPGLVQRFVAATLRSWDYSLKHPEEALLALENSSAENATSDAKAKNRIDLPEVFKLIKPAVPGKPFGTQSEADWETMQKLLIEYRVVRESRPVSQYLTNRFIP